MVGRTVDSLTEELNPEDVDWLILSKAQNPSILRKVRKSNLFGVGVDFKNAAFTAQPNLLYLLDSSNAAFNITLPSPSENGWWVRFADAKGSNPDTPTGLGLHPVVILPAQSSNHNIQGTTGLTLNKDNQAVELTFWNNRWTITFTAHA